MKEDIGARLKEERERLGLGVDVFAARVGVATSTQRNYEKGARSPDADYLLAIDANGADLGYVLTGNRTAARTAAEVLDDECRTLESVISWVDEVIETRSIALDSAKRRECILYLYRAARRGLELDAEVVRPLLLLVRAGCTFEP